MEVLILQTASKSPPDYANVKSGKYSPDQLADLLIRWDDLNICNQITSDFTSDYISILHQM